MKNLPNFRVAKSRVIRSLSTDKLGSTQMSSSHLQTALQNNTGSYTKILQLPGLLWGSKGEG